MKNLCSIGGYFFSSLALALLMVGVLGMSSDVLADPGDPGSINSGLCPYGGSPAQPCLDNRVCYNGPNVGTCLPNSFGTDCTCVSA